MDQYLSAFKKYAVFNGRATREEYWIFTLVNSIIVFAITALLKDTHLSFIGTLYVLFTLVPTIALGARRLHDVGKSGWMLLLILIPFIGQAIIMAYAVIDSQTGTNDYGPNPKGDGYVGASAKGLAVLVIAINVIITLAILAILGSVVFMSPNSARELNSKVPDKMNQAIEQTLKKAQDMNK